MPSYPTERFYQFHSGHEIPNLDPAPGGETSPSLHETLFLGAARRSVRSASTFRMLSGGHPRDRNQHIVFAHDKVRGVQGRQLETMAVGDCVSRAGLDAVSAKNATIVVDIVGFGIALARRDPFLFRILCRLDKNTVRGAGGRAQKAGDALFETVFVSLQFVCATKTLLELRSPQRSWTVGIIFYLRRLQHLLEGDAHALGNARDVTHDRHEVSIRWNSGGFHHAQ